MNGRPQLRKKTWFQSMLFGLLSVGLAVLFGALAFTIYWAGRGWGMIGLYVLFMGIFCLPLELAAVIVPGNYLLHAAWSRNMLGQKQGFFYSYSSGLWLLLIGIVVLLLLAAHIGSTDVWPFLALPYAWPLAIWLYCILAKLNNLY